MSKIIVTKEELIERYVNVPNASMQDVADALGCGRSTVAKAIKKYGLPTKQRGTRPDKYLPQLSDKEWLKEQLATKTFRQLAKELGVSVGRIADRAYRYGIRSPSSDKSEAVKEGIAKRFPDGRFGIDASHWRGGRRISPAGYVFIMKPDHPYASKTGYVQEHRLVMEEYLGRILEPDEVVHHRDGNKQNNTIENLEVLLNGQHISDHFKASHDVVGLRKRVIELEKEIEQLNKTIKELTDKSVENR